MNDSSWRPSNRQLTAQWWARFFLRYLIGGGGLIWEILVDRLTHPEALVVFGGLAGIPDVLGYRAVIKREAEREARETRSVEDDNP